MTLAKNKKLRADVALVSRGLVETRAKAQALILAGSVHTEDRRIDKAGEAIGEEVQLFVRGAVCPYVSRGGLKLDGALTAFSSIAVGDCVAADIGASTGGFTDVLLRRGAQRVYAIDVGYGQLHHSLRGDPRVVVMERTNARHLEAEHLGEPVTLIVVDASFIGLGKLLPAMARIGRPGADVVALVKPQFEVGPGHLGKHGVVRDDQVRDESVDAVEAEAQGLGFQLRGRADAPIKGPRGNQETFLWLQTPREGTTP